MSFKLLRYVIAHLRKTGACPSCQARFDEDYIFVLATHSSPETAGCGALFFVVCKECTSAYFVIIEMSPASGSQSNVKREIRMETKAAGPGVSVNDVLDMHNFLKSWKGDVSELLR